MPRRSRPSGRPSTTSPPTSKGRTLRELIDALPPERAAAVFTHSSWAADRTDSYERLEFLGDSVLELAVARTLYDRFPEFSEGRMAKVRSHVVSRASCAVVARELALGERLREQEGLPVEEVERLSRNRNVLAALLEAAIAAVYLEHGFEHVEPAVVAAFDSRIEYALTSHVDHKTELQETLARLSRSVTYTVLDVQGPPHDRSFTAAAVIDGKIAGTGTGRAKKGAEQAAAEEALESPLAAGGQETATSLSGRPRPPIACPRVPLKAIKLRGFKSFVDPVEIRLEPGVAVVVGPNGSGKSNVSDSILWATGSMSPGELRAEKPDDVLFAGAAGRQAVDSCEVDLLFDNSDDAWPDLPYSEVSVARRLTRGGEGQYLVNRTPVRRIDLVELLSDVGLGGGLRSVISQGRVETVLNSKPAERRELIEEAAGLGRFKRRRHRAELKLARVAVQVERARDLEEDVRKRLRPLALQATAAERAERLAAEIARLQARLAQLDLAAIDARAGEARRRREEAQPVRARRQARLARLAPAAIDARAGGARGRREEAQLVRARIEERLDALLAERNRIEDRLTEAARHGEEANAALYRLRSATERVAMRR